MSIYVGMDVHRKRSQVAVVDDAGVQQRNRNLANDPAKLVPILGTLPPGTPVAFEAAYGWGWLVELLEELELEPHLVLAFTLYKVIDRLLRHVERASPDRSMVEALSSKAPQQQESPGA
jgi:hypothetical protein